MVVPNCGNAGSFDPGRGLFIIMNRLFNQMIFLVVFLLAVYWVPGISEARTFNHEKAGVLVDLPDYWGVQDKQGVIVTSPRDGSVLLVFGVVPQHNLQQALRELDRQLLNFVKSPKIEGRPESVNVNGMKGYSVGASGMTEGKKVDIAVLILDTHASNMFLVLGIGEKGKFEKHVPVVEQILGSLRPNTSSILPIKPYILRPAPEGFYRGQE